MHHCVFNVPKGYWLFTCMQGTLRRRNALTAFVQFGIVCPYVVSQIFLSEECLTAQLQEKNEKKCGSQ